MVALHVLLDDCLGYEHPHTGSPVRPLGGDVRFENPVDDVVGNAAAVVGNGHDAPPLFDANGYHQPGAGGLPFRKKHPVH